MLCVGKLGEIMHYIVLSLLLFPLGVKTKVTVLCALCSKEHEERKVLFSQLFWILLYESSPEWQSQWEMYANIWKGIYWDVAHVVTKAEKYHDTSSAGWSSCQAGSAGHPKSKGLTPRHVGSGWCNSQVKAGSLRTQVGNNWYESWSPKAGKECLRKEMSMFQLWDGSGQGGMEINSSSVFFTSTIGHIYAARVKAYGMVPTHTESESS